MDLYYQRQKVVWEQDPKAHPFICAEYWEKNFADVKEAILEAEVYVYAKGTKICGFAGVADTFLAGLFVDQKQRKKGIGTALIRHLQNVKKELQLNVYEKNIGAVSFYIKQGFIITTTETDDAVGQEEYNMR